MLDQRSKTCSGFILLDAVIAAILLAVAMMAASQIILDVNNLRQVVESKRLVTDVVCDQLREVEATPFAEIQAKHNGRGFGIAQVGGKSLEAPPGDADGLPGLITVTVPEPATGVTGVVDVAIEAQWSDHSGARSIRRQIRISQVGANP